MPRLKREFENLYIYKKKDFARYVLEWSGGAMGLGILPVTGRSTNLDYSMARAYCACSRFGWGLFGLFFYRLSSGRVAQSVVNLTRKSEVLGSIPGLATYFRFSFR